MKPAFTIALIIIGILLMAVFAATATGAEAQEATAVTVNGFGSWEEAYEDAMKKWLDAAQ